MADISVTQSSDGPGRSQPTWIFILVAVLAVAALIWWLAIQSQAVQGIAVVEETPVADTVTGGEAPARGSVELAAIAAAPDSFVNQRVQVSGVSVAATLGEGTFWAEVPGANPFLVVLSPEAEQPSLATGQTLDLAGSVALADEAALDEWIESGALPEGRREEAAFATHYLLADQLSMVEAEEGQG